MCGHQGRCVRTEQSLSFHLCSFCPLETFHGPEGAPESERLRPARHVGVTRSGQSALTFLFPQKVVARSSRSPSGTTRGDCQPRSVCCQWERSGRPWVPRVHLSCCFPFRGLLRPESVTGARTAVWRCSVTGKLSAPGSLQPVREGHMDCSTGPQPAPESGGVRLPF